MGPFIPDGNYIHVVVKCLEALDGLAWPHVGVKVKLLSQCKVERPNA